MQTTPNLEKEYLRETIGENLSDEQQSDGFEYLDSLRKKIRIEYRSGDWSYFNYVAKKIETIERVLDV